MTFRIVFLAFVALTVSAVSASAQLPGGCFRGRPPSVCRSFWITDAAVGVQVLGGARDTYLAAEIGWMRSTGDAAAVGAGVAAGWAGDGFASLRPRYRRWLSPATAIDAAVGVRWTPGRVEQAEALVGLSWHDWGGVWGGVVADLGAQQVGAMLGAKGSSYAGLVSYAIAAITIAVWVASLPYD